MPVCIKCSTSNPDATKYCQKCGAILPQMAPTGASVSALDVDEHTQYLSPTCHYPAEELLNMAWAANDFLEEGADLDPFLDAYEIVKKKFGANMHECLARLQDLIADDRARNPEEPFPKQVAYLYNKGAGLADEGVASVESFLNALDEDKVLPERLKDGVVKLVMANDHFCFAIALTHLRVDAIKDALRKVGITENEDGELVAGAIPQAPGAAAAVPVAVGAAEEGGDGGEEEEEE